MTNILQLIDSLESGGAERVAVNLANELIQNGNSVTLCATRNGGPLQNELLPGVEYICLHKKSFLDLRAFSGLTKLIQEKNIQIIHAHSSSVYYAILCKLLLPGIKVFWHIHLGSIPVEKSSSLFYIPIIKKVDGIITVTTEQAIWVEKVLHISRDRIWS